MRFTALLLLVIAGITLCSCATFTPRERHDAADLSVPSAYTLYEEGAPAPDQWWQSFNSGELNGLVADALQDHLTLAQVYARLEQARQAVVQAGAARYPAVSASGDASVTLRHTEAVVAADTTKVISEQLSALNTLLGGAGGSPQERRDQPRRRFNGTEPSGPDARLQPVLPVGRTHGKDRRRRPD